MYGAHVLTIGPPAFFSNLSKISTIVVFVIMLFRITNIDKKIEVTDAYFGIKVLIKPKFGIFTYK